MYRVTSRQRHALLGIAATRALEHTAAGLPAHTLMQRAGLAVARLAMAVAPHAQTIWVACGPGNNGGDGLEAAMHLRQWGKETVVTWLGNESGMPADAHASLDRARAAGVRFSDEPPESAELCLDALLGIGSTRTPEGRMAQWIAHMNHGGTPVLAVDVPSGLNAETGASAGGESACVRARWTLSLLALKPGLFTAHGRDAAGEVWLDDLGVLMDEETLRPTAWLLAEPAEQPRRHASHKGSYGDVAVIGGAPGMTGAAVLAAGAALHAGAGRVFVGLLDGGSMALAPDQPELMFRDPASLDLSSAAVVCGCGGGDAVRQWLPKVLSVSARLVLDADALNAVAADTSLRKLLAARAGRGHLTVLTPHPLEAARLAGSSPARVQANRLAAASDLAEHFQCVVVLKGSGTVIAAAGATPDINPSGNARLATAGTGDVLAGMIGAGLAAGMGATRAACEAVFRHGALADAWNGPGPLTASLLARGLAHAPRES